MPMTSADVEKYVVAELRSNEKLIRGHRHQILGGTSTQAPLLKMALPMKMEVQPGRQS